MMHSGALPSVTHCVANATVCINAVLQVWEKHGQAYLTLGLYVDLNEGTQGSCKGDLPMAEDPAFVLPNLVETADIFAGVGDLASSDRELKDGRERQAADETAAGMVMRGKPSRLPTPSDRDVVVTSFARPGRGVTGRFRDVSLQGGGTGIGRSGPLPDIMPYATVRKELEA